MDKEKEIQNLLKTIVVQYKDNIPKFLEIVAQTLSDSTSFFDQLTSKNTINEIFDKFIITSNDEEINEISRIAETPKKYDGSLNSEKNNAQISRILAPKSPDLDFIGNDDDDDAESDSTYIPETQMHQIDENSSEEFLFVAPPELNSMRPPLDSQLVVDFMNIEDTNFTSILSSNNNLKKLTIDKECQSEKDQQQVKSLETITNSNENRDDCRSTTPDLIFDNLIEENVKITKTATTNNNNNNNNKEKIDNSTTTTESDKKTNVNDDNKIKNPIFENSYDFNMAPTQIIMPPYEIRKQLPDKPKEIQSNMAKPVMISGKLKSTAQLSVNNDHADLYSAETQIFKLPTILSNKTNKKEIPNSSNELLDIDINMAETQIFDITKNSYVSKSTKSSVQLDVARNGDDDDDDDPYMAATQIFEQPTISAKRFKSNEKNCDSPFLSPKGLQVTTKQQTTLVNIDPYMEETQMFDIDEISTNKKSSKPLNVHKDDDDDPYMAATQLLKPPEKINDMPIQPNSSVTSNDYNLYKELTLIESKTNNPNNISNSKYKIDYYDSMFDDSMDFDKNIDDKKELGTDETQMFINNEPTHEDDIFNADTQLLIPLVPTAKSISSVHDDKLSGESKSDKENDKILQIKNNKNKSIKNNQRHQSVDSVEVDTPQFSLIKHTKPHKIIKAELMYQNLRKQLPKKPMIFIDSSEDDNDLDDDKNVNSKPVVVDEASKLIIKKEPKNEDIKKTKKFIHKVPSSSLRRQNKDDSGGGGGGSSSSKEVNNDGPETIVVEKRKSQMNRRKSTPTPDILLNKEQSPNPQQLRLTKSEIFKNSSTHQLADQNTASVSINTIKMTTTTTSSKLLNSPKPNICDLFGDSDGSEETIPTKRKRTRKAIILADTTSKAEEKLRKQRSSPIKKQKTDKNSTDNAPTNLITTINDVRRSNRPKKIRILFTQIDPKPFIDIIQSLGGFVVDSPDKCDILITNKIYRTYKFLSAIGKGAKIVDVNWLREVLRTNRFVSTDKYSLKDPESEKRYKFNLKKSLDIAISQPLFKNYSIYVTPNTKPLPLELKAIIECAGGTCLLDIKQLPSHPNDKIITISDKKDQKLWTIYRKKYPSMIIINTEGFMLSIMRQYISFDSYTF